jgi:hypothetical protein
MAQQIEQGDYIFFQDATQGGPPVLWDWYFPGGSPTGSGFQNPIIRYLAPNSSGYNVSLYVEDAFSIYSTKTENNAIYVTPENLSSITLSTNLFATLSENVTYTVSGPTGKLSFYSWSLPGTGGFTGATSQTQSLKIDSWLSITGSELGAAYSVFPTTASVTYFSVIGNSTSASTGINLVKSGYKETFNFLQEGGNFPSPTTQYFQVINTVFNTVAIGMGGGGQVFRVGQPYYPNAVENLSSRVQGEGLQFWSCSSDFPNIGGLPGSLEPLQFVASKTAFDVLGVPYTGWEGLSRYTLGNYMFPNDLSTYFNSTFYFGDAGNNLSNPTILSDVGISNFNSLFFNDAYYASQSSVSITGSSLQPAALILNLDGAAGASGNVGLQCLPAFSLVGGDVKLTITIENSVDGTISGYSSGSDDVIGLTISDGGNPNGNSPDGTLFFAQDTTGASGYVSLINSAIASAGFSSNIEAFASPDYCYKPNAYSTNVGDYFQGMKIVIKDRVNALNSSFKIIRVRIEGNHGSWNFPYDQYPVAGNSNPSGNWLGFYSEYVSNPYQEIFTGEQPFRGFIFKGNT